jgi:hypothetical protein
VLSPLLANVSLHELDTFIEETIIPQYTQGEKRKRNPEYRHLEYKIRDAKARQDWQAVKRSQQERRFCPSLDTHDLDYRRLSFGRDADDFLLSFTRPKAETEPIKTAIGTVLCDRLHLTMSAEKTLITMHAPNKPAFSGMPSVCTMLMTNWRGSHQAQRCAAVMVEYALACPRASCNTRRLSTNNTEKSSVKNGLQNGQTLPSSTPINNGSEGLQNTTSSRVIDVGSVR